MHCLMLQVRIAIRNNLSAEGASVESVVKQIRGVPEKTIRFVYVGQKKPHHFKQ